VVRSIIGRLTSSFNISIAEVEELDARQTAVLGVAMIGTEAGAVKTSLARIGEALRAHPVAELLDCEIDV
jgi:uncharacterized protein YlxP (DUF503 family)